MAVDATPPRSRDPRRGGGGQRSGRQPAAPRGPSPTGVSGRPSGSRPAPSSGSRQAGGGSTRTPSQHPGPQQARQGSSRQGSARQGDGRPGGLDPAGRHANGVSDGFGRLIGFTVLGAAVPGSGLVAAGRRKVGWAIIALLVVAVAAAVTLVVSARAQDLALRLGANPDVLLLVAVGIGVVAAAWCAVIVASHLALRRRTGTGGQRAIAVLLVAALMGLVALPAATASRYALSARSSLIAVFDAGGATADRPGAAPDTEAADPWAGEPRVNVLLLGSDHDAQHTGIRPDTLIVASIDTRSGDTTLVSLPRNLQKVPFPPGSEGAKEYPSGYCGATPQTQCILNAIWGDWGEAHPEYYPDSKDPGLAATRSVVSTIIGMPIDYSVVINIDGFREIVDAMGGLTVDVPKRLPIGGGLILGSNGAELGEYPVDGYILPGEDQLLDGYRAMWFARSRWQSDDNERINRQRCVLQAAVQQYGPLKIAQAFPAIADTANRNIETDIEADQIPAFVTLGKRVKAGNLTSLAFTKDVVDTTDPDYPKMRQLIQQALLASEGDAPTATPDAPSAGTSAGATTAPSGPDGEDPLAAPKSDPIVDPATVCG